MVVSRKSRRHVPVYAEMLESRTLLTTYSVPTTIAHDYSTDVTTQIQAFLDSVPDGTTADPSVIEFPALAYDDTTVGYKIEGTLNAHDMANVIVEGNGAFFRAFNYDPPNPRERRHWIVRDSDGVTLQNFTIYGADPSPGAYSPAHEAQHGVDIGRSNHVMVDNVDIYNVAGDFVYIGAQSGFVTIQNCYMQGAGRQGIAPCDCHDVLIQNNTWGLVARHGVDIEPETTGWTVKNIRFLNNTTGQSKLSWFQTGTSKPVNNVLIAGNTVNGPNGFQFTLSEGGSVTYRRSNWIVANNDTFRFNGVSTYYDVGMKLNRTNGAVVAGNAEIFGPNVYDYSGVSLTSDVGAIVADNKWVNATTAVDSIDSSSLWTSDNLLLTADDPNWASETTMIELAVSACYGFVMPYNGVYEGQQVTGGHMYVISRYVDDYTSLTFNGLTTTDREAAVIVDANGNFVAGWTLGENGTSTYGGNTLEELHDVAGVYESPKDQWGAVGQTVQFTCIPTGDDPLTYQWQRNGVDIPGATRNELRYTIQPNDDAATFICIVDNPYAAAFTSAAATLHVVPAAAPTIVTQPISQSIAATHTATFTVSAAGSQGPLTYQWKKNGADITGATAASYTTPVTVVGDNGSQYTCVVTNPSGSTTSNAATLSVVTEAAAAETWTGADNSAWPAQWTREGGAGTLVIYGNQGRHTYLSPGGRVISYINTTNVENVEQFASFTLSSNNANAGLIARRADSNSDTYYYAQLVRAGNSYLRLFKVVDGVDTILATSPFFTWVAGGTYNVRFSVQTSADAAATVVAGKVWLSTNPEPDWGATYTDNTLVLQGVSGRTGTATAVSSGRTITVDNYSTTVLPIGPVSEAPTTIQVTAVSSRHVSVQWDNQANELGYKLERSTDGTTWTEIAAPAIDSEAFTDATVNPNTLYYYRIRTYTSSGFSSYSASASLTTPSEPATPAAPLNLQVAATSSSEISLSWVDNSSTEYGFKIEHSLDGATGWLQVGLVGPGSTSFLDTSLAKGTMYHYRVYAFNNSGNSAYTPVASAITLMDVFGETWTAPDGSAWPAQWTQEGAGTLSILNNRGQHDYLSPGGRVVSYINTATAENTDEVATFTISANNANAGLIARRADDNNDTYYSAQIVNSLTSSYIRLFKMVDGTETTLATSSYFSWVAGAQYKIRFTCTTAGASTNLQAKVWLATGSEPATWSATASDSTASLQGVVARFGIFTHVSSGRIITVDDYSCTANNASTVYVLATDNTGVEVSQNKGTFTVYRTNSLGGVLTVHYTIGGTAGSGDYHETLSGVVEIPAGQLSATLDITPVDDNTADDAETVIVTLSTDPSYLVGTPNSASLTIYDYITEGFESGNGTGGIGWGANWSITGSASVQTNGIHTGTKSLRLTSNNGVAARAVDMSAAVGSHLTYWWRAYSFEAGEYATVEIYNGTTWTEVARYIDGQDDNVYHYADINLSSYTLTSSFQVRFVSYMGDASDYLYIDDVAII